MDRALATLLRSWQASSTIGDATRLLPTALSLIIRLSNPLNITLLTSQTLSNPVAYPQPIDVTSSRRIFTLFYTAAIEFVKAEQEDKDPFEKSDLTRAAWTKAVIQGIDEKSPRWRHTLALGGLLLGFSIDREHGLPGDLRKGIENALVTATNLSLAQPDEFDVNNQLSVIWVLNATFAQLSDFHRSLVDYELLLPWLIDATFFSRDGLEHGYWLGVVDADVKQVADTNTFSWPSNSPSALRVQEIRSRNLTSSLGPLSRLIAHSVENVQNTRLIVAATEKIAEFSRNILLSWRQNKLSEVDQSEEREYLDRETITVTMPVLHHILRDTLFAIVICLRAVFGRLLVDSTLASGRRAPTIATRCLHILRDIYFISHRFGQTSSSQYMFVYLTAVDVLNQYPEQALAFLSAIKPLEGGQVSQHPLERLHDLYFLNVAENFTLMLSPESAESLLLNAAMPYVTAEGDKRLGELYEAAHSVLLAVFTAPQNSSISSRHIPSYIETVLRSFPAVLSPRQFRLAVKSTVRLAAPAFPLSTMVPLMQSIIMEMLRERSIRALEALLPTSDTAPAIPLPLSEKSTLLISMIDCLSCLSIQELEEWLPITAESVHKLVDPSQKSFCQDKFWEVLSNGEMGIERAGICVAWWSTKGGKELLLFGEQPEELFEMSGAVQESRG